VARLFKSVTIHEPKKHGTSIGRKPITSTMNKHKEEVLKNIEDKEKQDECQKPDSKYKSSFEWCQFFDIK